MWVVCTSFVWFWMIKYRERAIKGMEGSDGFWAGHEQVIYWSTLATWPIVFKAAFIADSPLWVWYFLGFAIGFALFGTKLADYILAFFGRREVKSDQPDTKTTTTTTTETK